MIDTTLINAFKLLNATPKNVVITTHHKPDGDAMGSSLALQLWLEKKGHKVELICPTDWAAFLNFLPSSQRALNYEIDTKTADKKIIAADAVFCLDFNHPSRINDLSKALLASKATKFLIDHHQDPYDFCDYVYSRTSACSTSEMIYDLLLASDCINDLDKDIATCIYTGIVSDTGRFLHRNTSAHVMHVASELLKHNIDITLINEHLFSNYSIGRLLFIGHCITNCMEVLPEYKTAILRVTHQDLKKFNIQTGDTENLVNYPMMLENINFVALIIDRTVIRKLSLRSKGSFKCNELASKHFDGGGHINASGGATHEGLNEAVSRLKALLPDYKEALNY